MTGSALRVRRPRLLGVVALSALGLLVGAASCTDAPPLDVPFSLVFAPGDDPLLGVSALVLEVERDGEVVARARAGLDATSLPLPALPFAPGYRLRVEAVDGALVLARGTSFPFTVDERGATPPPHVFLGRLGRAVAPLGQAGARPDGAVLGLAPTADGAVLVSTEGTVYVYRQHDGPDGLPSLTVRAHLPGRAWAAWVDLGDGRLLGVGGATAGATVVDANGDVVATEPLSPELDGLRLDVCLARTSEPVTSTATIEVIAVGGRARTSDPPGNAVVRIDIVPTEPGAAGPTLGAIALEALPSGVAGAACVAVHPPGATVPATRVVVAGGVDALGATGDAFVLDPEAVQPIVRVALGAALADRAVVRVSDRVVVIAGGLASDGRVSGDFALLDVDTLGASVVEPRPSSPFLPARARAAGIALGNGVVVLFGGRELGGLPSDSASLIDVGLDAFPGVARPTGALPVADDGVRAVRLADESVLVVGGRGVALYVSPR